MWEQRQLCSLKQPGQETQVRAKSLAGCFWCPLSFSRLVLPLPGMEKEPLGKEGLASSLSGKGLL